MGNTSEFDVVQLNLNMCHYDFNELFTWLIVNFNHGAWSREDFELYNCRWGWVGTGERTEIFFRNANDALLFRLTWIEN